MFSRNRMLLTFVVCSLELFAVGAFSTLGWKRRARAVPLLVASTLYLDDIPHQLFEAPPPVAPKTARDISTTPTTPSSVLGSTTSMHIPSATAADAKTQSSSVKLLATTQELLDTMEGDGSPEKLVVIKYHAHYCKICQRAGLGFKKVATEYPDVQFAKVESLVFPDKAKTLRSLGVTRFPFVQIYRQGKCVASFSTGPSHRLVRRVRANIYDCRQRSKEEWEEFSNQSSDEIQSNLLARRDLTPQP